MIAIYHVDCDEISLKPERRFCRRGFITAITKRLFPVCVPRPVHFARATMVKCHYALYFTQRNNNISLLLSILYIC